MASNGANLIAWTRAARSLVIGAFGVVTTPWATPTSASGSTRPILLKNSLSVQTRFVSFIEGQPKIRGKHDVWLTEKD